jgi:hypothetical protein
MAPMFERSSCPRAGYGHGGGGWAMFGLFMVAALAAGCGGGGKPTARASNASEESSDASEESSATTAVPSPAEIEVVPPVVHGEPGVAFEMRAIVRDADGEVLPEFARDSLTGEIVEYSGLAVTWEVEGPDALVSATTLKPVPNHFHRIRVTLPTATTSTSPLLLVAQVDGLEGSARVVIVDPAAATTGDGIRAPHTANQPPEVVIVDGLMGGAAQQDLVVPLARGAVLGDLDDAAGQLSQLFLASQSRADYESVQWAGDHVGTQLIDRSTLGKPLEIPVAVWIAGDGLSADSVATLKDRAIDDVALANALFAEYRTGITFTIIAGHPVAIPTASLSVDDVNAAGPLCQVVQDFIPGPEFKLKKLHLLHVVYLQNDYAGFRGRTCLDHTVPSPGWPLRRGPIVLIFLEDRSPTTLAHEFGHVLGLSSPYQGHTHVGPYVDEFDRTNLMWGNHLSLGQAAWMNIDQESWLQRAIVDPRDPGSSDVRPTGSFTTKCSTNPQACPIPPTDLSDAH